MKNLIEQAKEILTYGSSVELNEGLGSLMQTFKAAGAVESMTKTLATKVEKMSKTEDDETIQTFIKAEIAKIEKTVYSTIKDKDVAKKYWEGAMQGILDGWIGSI